MRKNRTHYDNLKVPRDASPEAIRAAYRRLAMRHHPDRNPGDGKAGRRMAAINRAYRTLSDPERRRGHDLWIAAHERPAHRLDDDAHATCAPTAQPAWPHEQPESYWLGSKWADRAGWLLLLLPLVWYLLASMAAALNAPHPYTPPPRALPFTLAPESPLPQAPAQSGG